MILKERVLFLLLLTFCRVQSQSYICTTQGNKIKLIHSFNINKRDICLFKINSTIAKNVEIISQFSSKKLKILVDICKIYPFKRKIIRKFKAEVKAEVEVN